MYNMVMQQGGIIQTAKIQLYPHQQKALDAWYEHGCRGIIKSLTGTGKTFIALKAIETNHTSILIVVPTIPIMEQWVQLVKSLGLDCGTIGDGTNNPQNITVAIINSLNGKNILCRLLIADECHRYCSPEFFKNLMDIKTDLFMGLSATPERDNTMYEQLISKYPIVYEHTLEDGMNQGTICEFETKIVKCELNSTERINYDAHTATIKKTLPIYGNSIQVALAAIKRGGEGPAIALTKAMQGRKQIITNSTAKILKAAEMINEMNKKTIVFSENINSLDILKCNLHPSVTALIYHSKIKKKDRTNVIEQFKTIDKCVLLSARALDEGISITDVDTAIMLSGSSSKRQYLQRLGRILRPKDNKKATLYEFVIANSVEEKWAKKRRK